jgi:peptidyl-prolyl cis-trans isomerase C
VRSSVLRRLAAGVVVVLAPVFFGCLLGCGSDLPEGVVAQVGDSSIPEEQLTGLLAAYEAAGKAPDKDKQPDQYQLFKQKCTEYLVTLEVMRQSAPEFGVTVTEEDVAASLDQIRSMFLGDDAKFNAAVAAQGMTLEQLTEAVRQNVWFEKMRAAVTAKVTVREEAVRAYYQEHMGDYVEPESRTVRHILISPFLDAAGNLVAGTPTETDWEAAEIEAAKVRSEIMNGTDFVTEVELYSDDESSNTAGGDLGDIVRGQTVPAFEQAVFNLKKGEISQPVRTPSGYHIIQVLEITPALQMAYDFVKEQIRTMLLREQQTAVWDEWLTETMQELGVIYRKGYAPPGAIQGPAPTSTTLEGQIGETSTSTTLEGEIGETTTSTVAE